MVEIASAISVLYVELYQAVIFSSYFSGISRIIIFRVFSNFYFGSLIHLSFICPSVTGSLIYSLSFQLSVTTLSSLPFFPYYHPRFHSLFFFLFFSLTNSRSIEFFTAPPLLLTPLQVLTSEENPIKVPPPSKQDIKTWGFSLPLHTLRTACIGISFVVFKPLAPIVVKVV